MEFSYVLTLSLSQTKAYQGEEMKSQMDGNCTLNIKYLTIFTSSSTKVHFILNTNGINFKHDHRFLSTKGSHDTVKNMVIFLLHTAL